MSLRTVIGAAAALAFAFTAPALSQSMNMDIGSYNAAPSAAYGAGAGQPGVWNHFTSAAALPLVDTLGGATPASVSASVSTSFTFGFNNALTFGDDELLLDGGHDGNLTLNYIGLLNGTYDVYTYAWAPDNRTGYFTKVDVSGSCSGPQIVGGGTWTGVHIEGITYAKHTVAVSGGTLQIVCTNSTGFTTVNGVQLHRTVAGVFEDFEHNNLGLYTAVGGGPSTITSTAAHDGVLGLSNGGAGGAWYYRTDIAFGPGSVMRSFVRLTSTAGRCYVGLSADASGCWSAVIAGNTNELVLQENAAYSYIDRANVAYAWALNTWYQVETKWAANGDMTVNLYDQTGTTLLASTPTYASGQLAVKGYAVRGFAGGGSIDVDTFSLVPPISGVFENFEHGNLGLYTATGTNGSTSIIAAAAHDGSLGTRFVSGSSPWFYRTDITVGPGSVTRFFVRPTTSTGRAYVGLSADAGGCWSAVVSTNAFPAPSLILQENLGYGFTDRATIPFAWVSNTWYQVEMAWAANGDMTLNLYDESGSTLLASTPTYASGQLVAKGIAMRGFDNTGSIDIDTRRFAGGCAPPPITFCVAKTTSVTTAGTCLPAMASLGQPSASAGSGFYVQGTNFINNKNCLLFYGNTGQASLPYQGGTLCVKSPIKRTPSTNTHGNLPPNDCSGVPSIDMNRFAVGGLGGTPLPALTVPGTVVDCQWWGRDPGLAAPNNTMLSNGLEYVVGP